MVWKTCGFLTFFPQPDWEKSVFKSFHRLKNLEVRCNHWRTSIFQHFYTLYYY